MDQKTTGSGDSVRLSYLPSSTTPITSAKGPSTPPRKCLPTASGLCRIRLARSEEHTSELQSLTNLVCRLLLEKKKVQTRFAPLVAYVHVDFAMLRETER